MNEHWSVPAWERCRTVERFVAYVNHVIARNGSTENHVAASCRRILQAELESALRLVALTDETPSRHNKLLTVATARLALFNSIYPVTR